MKHSIRTIAALIMITAILCGSAGCTSGGKSVKAADLMEGVTPNPVSAGRKAGEFSEDVTDFAVRLFRNCEMNAERGENVLVSPVSVLLALSMTANGAQKDTLAQMEDVLGMKTADLNEFAYAFLNSVSDDKKYKGTLMPADSVWFKADPDFHVNRDFLQLNADYYNAQIYSEPFDDTTLKAINKWVKDKTDGMIPTILDRIPENAIMYLVNALAFDAEWQDIYKENQVRDDTFTTGGGEKKQLSFMFRTENDYLEDDKVCGFIKYYRGKRYAFAALLPEEGITPEEYLSSL
ncbi:MAG: serine protease, partial [Lachnospiraceae bacterium]|nr:serine protease [Lachnospiraceae bacterium]